MQLSQSLFLWPGDGPALRGLEIGLAYVIELIWPKRRIIEVYLNTAQWGDGIFGAEAAAKTFFGKPAVQLTRREATLLAAALSDPLRASPAQPSQALFARANKIAAKMDAGRFDYSCFR
jgi:monofunctional biosynthetic peptidoglycan transglycosylase